MKIRDFMLKQIAKHGRSLSTERTRSSDQRAYLDQKLIEYPISFHETCRESVISSMLTKIACIDEKSSENERFFLVTMATLKKCQNSRGHHDFLGSYYFY